MGVVVRGCVSVVVLVSLGVGVVVLGVAFIVVVLIVVGRDDDEDGWVVVVVVGAFWALRVPGPDCT